MTYYKAMETNKLLPHKIHNCTKIMLNEKSQIKQRDIFRKVLKQAKLIRDVKVRTGITSGEKWGEGT